MDESDVAFRCNLVYLEVRVPMVVMGDYSGGHITTEEAKNLIARSQGAIGSEEFRFFPGVSYRHIMIWKNGKENGDDPAPRHIWTKRLIDYMPKGEGAETIIKLMSDSQIFLKNHPVNKEAPGERSSAGKQYLAVGAGQEALFSVLLRNMT